MEDYINWIGRGIIGFCIALFGWSYKKMRADIDETKETIYADRLYNVRNFLSKQEFEKFEKRLFDTLKEIQHDVNSKADKE